MKKNIAVSDYRKMKVNWGKKNKYNVAKKEDRTWTGYFRGRVQTIVFDSKMEYEVFLELRVKQNFGSIRDLAIHEKFSLGIGRKIYEADFSYYDQNNDFTVVDAKGVRTPLFDLKWERLKELHPDITFLIRNSKGEYLDN